MNNWIIINEFLSQNKPHIIGAVTPLLMVVLSYVNLIADWIRLGGLFVGLVVGILTGIKLIIEIQQAKQNEKDK